MTEDGVIPSQQEEQSPQQEEQCPRYNPRMFPSAYFQHVNWHVVHRTIMKGGAYNNDYYIGAWYHVWQKMLSSGTHPTAISPKEYLQWCVESSGTAPGEIPLKCAQKDFDEAIAIVKCGCEWFEPYSRGDVSDGYLFMSWLRGTLKGDIASA